MSNFIELIETVSKRPGMYLPDPTINSFISYINGYDAASNSGALIGFREWLVVKAGRGNNLVWWGISNEIVEGETEEEKIISLYGLLKTFYAEKNSKGIKSVFVNYQNWLQEQSWYDPSRDSKNIS